MVWRRVAQVLVFLWLLSPSLSYNFSELIEAHAVDTYGEFVDANAEKLAALPAPRITRLYYNGPDLFLFDEFQTSRPRGSRRRAQVNSVQVSGGASTSAVTVTVLGEGFVYPQLPGGVCLWSPVSQAAGTPTLAPVAARSLNPVTMIQRRH